MSLARMPNMRLGGAGGRTRGVEGRRGAPAPPPLSCLYSPRCKESWGGWGVGVWGVGIRAARHWRCRSACSTCGTLRRPAQKKVPSNFYKSKETRQHYESAATLIKTSKRSARIIVVSTKFGMLSRSVTISHVLRSNILSPPPHLSPNIDGNVVSSSSEAKSSWVMVMVRLVYISTGGERSRAKISGCI